MVGKFEVWSLERGKGGALTQAVEFRELLSCWEIICYPTTVKEGYVGETNRSVTISERTAQLIFNFRGSKYSLTSRKCFETFLDQYLLQKIMT